MGKKKSRKLLKTTSQLVATMKSMLTDSSQVDTFVAIPDVVLENSNDILLLDISIGTENQTGSTTISIVEDPSFTPLFIEGSTDTPLQIRPCASLDSKTLLLITEISDTNQDKDNNNTEVGITLRSSTSTFFQTSHQTTVKNEGDTAKFIFNISCHVL